MKAIESPYEKIEIMPTGFPALDTILGGGLHFRKIFQVSGIWSVGKSTLAMQIVARAQKEKHPCLYADCEIAWANSYAEILGVDVKALDLSIEDFAEAYLDSIEKWATGHKNGVIVLDAVGSLLPREEMEKGAEGRTIGGQARLVGAFCRRIVPILAKKNHALIVLNHQFTDIQSGRLKASGGEKLSYAISQWLTLKRSYGKPAKRTKDGKKTILFLEAEIRKNKLAATEGMKCELEMIPGQGFVSAPPTLFDAPKKRGSPPKVPPLST